MKKLKDILLQIVLPAVAVILAYIGYDCWFWRQKALKPQPVMSASVFRLPRVGPVIPYDKLPRRKYVEIDGTHINEKDFTRLLVLDLAGDGISVCGLKNIKKCPQWPRDNFFDFNQDGFREKTLYLGKDDVLLIYPAKSKKNKHLIEGDIIGTYFQGNKDKSLGAFDILRGLAGGKDVLKKGDEVFTKLFLWKYKGSKKVVAPQDLSGIGIEEISLNIVPNREILPSENILGDYTEVTFADGSKRKLQEVWLYNDNHVINYSQLPENEKTEGIPDIFGFGGIKSLWDAITQDESGKLEHLVRQYLNEPNFFIREALLPEIIYHWTGVADVDPLSRISEDGINHIGDARKVAAIEKLIGKPFLGTHTFEEETPNPHYQSTPYIWKSFDDWVNLLRLRLDESGILKPILIAEKQAKNNGKKALKNEIKKFENEYGALQTKLLFGSKCSVFSTLGKVSPQIDLSDCDEFIIKGTVEDDILDGKKNKDNIFIGSYRNDVLSGGEKADVYVYGLHDGGDVIKETGGFDRIMLLGDITPEKVSYEIYQNSLIIKIGSNGGGIMINDFGVSEDKQVEELVFADGKTVSLPEIYAKLPNKKENDAAEHSDKMAANEIQMKRFIDADARTMNAVINDGKWHSSAELYNMMQRGLLTKEQQKSVNRAASEKFDTFGHIVDKKLNDFYRRKSKRKKTLGKK